MFPVSWLSASTLPKNKTDKAPSSKPTPAILGLEQPPPQKLSQPFKKQPPAMVICTLANWSFLMDDPLQFGKRIKVNELPISWQSIL